MRLDVQCLKRRARLLSCRFDFCSPFLVCDESPVDWSFPRAFRHSQSRWMMTYCLAWLCKTAAPAARIVPPSSSCKVLRLLFIATNKWPSSKFSIPRLHLKKVYLKSLHEECYSTLPYIVVFSQVYRVHVIQSQFWWHNVITLFCRTSLVQARISSGRSLTIAESSGPARFECSSREMHILFSLVYYVAKSEIV